MRVGQLQQRLARGADDQRQREQRHHDPGGEERLPGDRSHCWRSGRGSRGSGREKISSPKIASTMLGTPAIISIADSTARASQRGRAYSDSHAASATPAGAAIAMPIAVTISVPIDRVEEAARVLFLQQRRRGRFDEQARAQRRRCP